VDDLVISAPERSRNIIPVFEEGLGNIFLHIIDVVSVILFSTFSIIPMLTLFFNFV